MTRETDAQAGMLERQLEHDREIRSIERLHDLMVQGAKGLVVLNGGAAVAVLALVQALVEKPHYFLFKPYAVGALLLFLLGAFLSGISFFFHYEYVNYSLGDKRRMTFWRRFFWGALAVSASCALLGGALITSGICVAV